MLYFKTHLKLIFLFRQSETEHKDIAEELPQSRPCADSTVEVVSDPITQDKVVDEVSIQGRH